MYDYNANLKSRPAWLGHKKPQRAFNSGSYYTPVVRNRTRSGAWTPPKNKKRK